MLQRLRCQPCLLGLLIIAISLLAWAPAAFPQSSPAALERALDRAQRVYQKQVQSVTSSMRQLYLERLAQLEQRAAEAGEYEQALALQKEGQRIRKLLGPSAETPFQFTLLAHEAERQGDLTLTANTLRTLTNWGPESSATWKLPAIIPPGGYEVAVAHRHHAGPLPCKLSAKDYHVSGRLEGAEGSEEALTTLGNLRITSDSSHLTLTLEASEGVENVQIKHLVLTSHAP